MNSNWKIWVFRGLVAIAALLIVFSAVRPWWSIDIRENQTSYQGRLDIYQYGIDNLPADSGGNPIPVLAGDITPASQVLLARLFIGLLIILALVSTWLRGKKGSLLLGGIGLAYIAYALVAAYVVITGRLAEFGIPLQGTYIYAYQGGNNVDLTTGFQLGYYLAYAAGGLLVILAMLRGLFAGKTSRAISEPAAPVKDWREEHAHLKDFIAAHAGIRIEPGIISIPEEINPEFYRQFDSVRDTFVRGKCPATYTRFQKLSRNYLEAERDVIRLLKLEGVELSKPLHWYLRDPLDGLRRELFDPLYELLKGRVDIDDFEKQSVQGLELSSNIYYKTGYEKWLALSLIELLKANQLFHNETRSLDRSDKTLIGELGANEGVMPPHLTRHLSFDYSPIELFALPNFVVHSADNRFISVACKSEMARPIATASNFSDRREWLPKEATATLEPGSILVYVSNALNDLTMVADVGKICRPDLLLEIAFPAELRNRNWLDELRSRHEALKPERGTLVIPLEAVPTESTIRMPGITEYFVGFEQARLATIVDLLNNKEVKK